MSRRKLGKMLKSMLIACVLVTGVFPGVSSTHAANNMADVFTGGNANFHAVSGNWTVSNGEYNQSSLTGSNVSVIANKRWGDATYELDLKNVNNGGNSANFAGLQFKKMNPNDNYEDSGYIVFVRANGILDLYKVNKSLVSVNTGLSFASYKHLKVVTSGTNIKVYINNESTPRINHNDASFASGYASLLTFYSNWSFDNINISGPELPYNINLGPAELLYADAQNPTFLDQSFATLKRDASSMYFFQINTYDNDLIVFHGPLDNPLAVTDFVKPDHSFIDRNGYDAGYNMYEIWMPNIYKIGPNELIAFTHNEKYPPGVVRGQVPYFSMGIAYSNDNGVNWEYGGEFLKPKNERVNIGGSPYVIVGDYFYLYYNEGEVVYDGTGPYQVRISVARARIQDVVTAARNNTVTNWYKYSNGSWTQSGLTGLGSPIIDNVYGLEDSHADATYNTALNKYLMTVQTHGASKLSLYSSSDGIVYSMEALVDVAPQGTVMHPYSNFMDLEGASDDGSSMDGEFYIMYPRKKIGNYQFDDLYRKHITITKNNGDHYSASSDFSSTQESDGWSYKQWNGTSYSNMTWDAVNKRWMGAQAFALISGSWQHPDTNDSVRAWKAPKAGTISLKGTVKKAVGATGGDGVNVKIMKNGTQIWPSSGWQSIANSNTTGFNHDLNLTVAANDMIYFIVNKNGTSVEDTTNWNPTIQYDLYSATSGFSSTQGTLQWSYEQWNGSSYSNMTWDITANRWKGSQNYALISREWQHPDTNDSVRAWRAPKAGKVRITGTPKKDSGSGGGDGVRVKIMKNGTQVWPSSGWKTIAYNNFTGIPHDFGIQVAANDKIYFIVNKNGTTVDDTTFWSPTVEYTGL